MSFRSARKRSSYLAIAKIYPLERTPEKWDESRCEVCLNIEETDTFRSTTTGKNLKMNHKLNCNDKCLTYLLTCNCCVKQYVGETTDEAMIGKMHGRKHICKNICLSILKVKTIVVFLEMFP